MVAILCPGRRLAWPSRTSLKAFIETLPLPRRGWAYHYDTRTRGLAIGVSHTGARSFIVYRKVSGRPERITLGRYPDLTIEHARGKAAAINAAIAHGENPADLRRVRRNEWIFRQLFDEYLERHAKRNKRTWEEDLAIFGRHIGQLANLKLSSIKRTDVAAIHSAIGKSHPRTANKVLALISSIFGRATEWGLWDKPNPARGIKRFKERQRDRFIQANELPGFFQAVADEPNETIRDYVLLSLLTGARRSNVLAMRWEEVNLEQGEWRIPETKNGTPQTVTLSPEAISILLNRKAANTSGYVFPGIGRTGHLKEPRKGWERILKRAGLRDLRIHDMRRTLGSWQAKTGASLSVIGKSLNHKNPSTTAIYARLDLGPVRESVDRATTAMLAAAGVKADTDILKSKKTKLRILPSLR